MTKRAWENVVLGLVAVSLYFVYFRLYASYPYYFAWDMDLTVSIDTLIIQSGQTPVHLNHPSFGLYFLVAWAQRFVQLWGELSVFDYPDLKVALNPMAAMAEHTDFIRKLSPAVALATVFFMWAAVVRAFRLTGGARVWLLLLFGLLEGGLFHATLVRSEIYGMLFLAAGWFALACAVRAARPVGRLGGVFLGGVALGLAFLTKIQPIFILAAVPLMLFVFAQFNRVTMAELVQIPERHRFGRQMWRWLAAGNLGFFLVCLFVAYRVPIPFDLGTFHESFKINLFAKAMALLLVGLALAVYLGPRWRAYRPWEGMVRSITLVMSGVFASFALHFFVYLSPRMGAKYFLYDFKMLFVRIPASVQIRTWEGFWSTLVDQVALYPWIFGANLAAFFVFLASRRVRERGRVALALGLEGLVVLNTAFGTRTDRMQDLVWLEPFPLVVGFCLLALAWPARRPAATQFTWPVSLSWALAVLSLIVGAHACGTRGRADDYLQYYGWQDHYWFDNVYGGWMGVYKEAMENLYGENAALKNIGARKARDFHRVRRDAQFLLRNVSVDHRNIGVLAEGFPLLAKRLGRRLSKVPPSLKEANFIDVNALRADGIRGEKLAVRMRADLKVVLFWENEVAVGDACGPSAKRFPDLVQARDASQVVTYRGLELTHDCALLVPPAFVAFLDK
ncbi:MAG: hypothetical protein AB7F66_03310 [Bacteriovoracia bacterium]